MSIMTVAMFNLILLILCMQVFFFTFYYLFGITISKVIGRRVCPVCFSVGSTWLALLILKYLFNADIPHVAIGLLLAESVVGVSYLVEEFLLINPFKVEEYILKFGIISYGTFSVMIFMFISELYGFLLFLPVIFFGFYALTPVKREKNILKLFLEILGKHK